MTDSSWALVGRCLDLLLPERLTVTDAPRTAEVSLMRQGTRHLVHIVNYHAGRRAATHVEALEQPVPLRDVTLRLRCSSPTTRVRLARQSQELPFEEHDGVVSVVVPRVEVHEIVIFEGG